LGRLDVLWPAVVQQRRWVVLTGGEPLLQLDRALLDALHQAGWLVALETNGTLAGSEHAYCDWVTASPKHGVSLALNSMDELKVVLPGGSPGWSDAELLALEQRVEPCQNLYVQPEHGNPTSTERCVSWVLAHPSWGLSLQTHKLLGLP
jgi:organic radical activating enzyme